MAARILAHFGVRCSMLDVRCFPSVQGFDARIFISGGLSMNRPSPGLRPPSPRLAGRGQGEGYQSGSWSQCMRKNERGLSMNRPLTPSLSPSDGERVAEGRVRGRFMGRERGCVRGGRSMSRRAVWNRGGSPCDQWLRPRSLEFAFDVRIGFKF